MLAQNKELKRLRKEADRRKAEEGEERELEDTERRARDLEEFERAQTGLQVRSGGSKAGERIVGRANGQVTIEQDVEGGSKGVKRKFEIDEDELVRLANEGEHKTKRKASEQNGDNAELPAFWVPSKIPDNHKSDLKAIKQQPTCPAAASNQPHDFTLKTLIPVHFNTEVDKNADKQTLSCPSCNKALSNATKAILGKPCGHVLCKPCSDKFQKPAESDLKTDKPDPTVLCYVCSEDVTPGRMKRKGKKKDEDGKEKDKVECGLVELSSEGTGFAGGGKNMVKREGVAFQC